MDIWCPFRRASDKTGRSAQFMPTACPASLQSLELFECQGLTPPSLRALLRLPLRKLTIESGNVEWVHLQELNEIARNEGPERFKERQLTFHTGY